MTTEALRHNKKPKLNIPWSKDRGKNVGSARCFKKLKGDQSNDHHLILAKGRTTRIANGIGA